ncbi:MAG TPA: hypothetical protein VFN22_12690 [Gemmatimonadales bacterium]|nr:hypothetical protein [Gemmatimonadales bacterium]
MRDTVIDAVFGMDSSFTGYSSLIDASSLPLSNGGTLGESRAVVRFFPRGDSVTVADTTYPLAIDSVIIRMGLQDRQATAGGLRVELYRLDTDVDSSITWPELTAQMVPGRLLGTVAIPDSVQSGPLFVGFSGADLAKFAYTPEDSTRLVIGIRLVAPVAGAGAYIGAVRSGDAGIFYQSWATIPVADTALRHPLVQRSPSQNFTVRPTPTPVTSTQLLVGGRPAGRALIRFTMPTYLRDSATIIRATLELTPDVPLVGLTGDSTRIDVNPILADFGAKSVTFLNEGGTTWIHPGDSTISLEVTRMVRLWQGTTPLPAIVRVRHAFEWSSFINPILRSTRSATTGAPRIRITYRPPFAVEGF